MQNRRTSSLSIRVLLGGLTAAAVAAAGVISGSAAGASAASAATQVEQPCSVTAPGRIVAVGDVHGAFDTYVRLLQAAGVIDDRNNWSGGNTTFVQLGNMVDRGIESTRVIELLQDLENQADDDGGAVHVLLGNHEVMRLTGDLSAVNPAEYERFKGPQAAPLRENFFEVVYEQRLAAARAAGQDLDDRAFRTQFFEDTPLGLVEMLQAYDAEGDIGRWLREKHALVKVNGVLFMHGGISPPLAINGCEAIAEAAREEIAAAWMEPTMTLLTRDGGPLSYTGYGDGSVTQADVDGALQALGATAMVVAHPVTEDRRIAARFNNKVFDIDTGMVAGEFFAGGRGSALEIQGGTFTAIYADGERVTLTGGDGDR